MPSKPLPDLARWLDPRRTAAPETSSVEAEERALLLRWCVTQLRNPEHIELLQLRYEHGWTWAQIAEHRGVVESAAYQMHARICQKLREYFEAAGIRSLRDIL